MTRKKIKAGKASAGKKDLPGKKPADEIKKEINEIKDFVIDSSIRSVIIKD